jgi:hypothetical protein
MEAPVEGSCERCRARVPMAETYEHDGRLWHRVARRKGAPCGPVVWYEYRLVFHVEEVRALPAPLTRDQWREMERQLTERAGVGSVACLMIQEGTKRPS